MLNLRLSICWDFGHYNTALLEQNAAENLMTLELIYPPLYMCESFVKLCYDCLEYLKDA